MNPPEGVPPTSIEELEKVEASVRIGSAAQVVLAITAVLAICYFGKLVLVTLCTSVLIAFILAPLVALLERIHIPRTIGAGISVLLVLGILYGLSYFFYARAVEFVHEWPHYKHQVQRTLAKYERQAQTIQNSATSVLPGSAQAKNTVPVRVEQSNGLSSFLSSSLGTVTDLLLTIAFIPFLVYFMLTWQRHTRRATVRLFGEQNQRKAYQTLQRITVMMRAFIAGNFYIGVFMSICTLVVFALLHIPYFYFLGFISGFLSLIPYLGVLLALAPPIVAGLGVIHGTGILIIFMTVLGLHLFSMNVLYPKIIGGRLSLNPLVVTIALVIWGWLWGAMGLILAVPITGALKILCDSFESLQPLGEWLGE